MTDVTEWCTRWAFPSLPEQSFPSRGARWKVARDLDAELERRHGLSLSSYDVLVQLSLSPGDEMRMSELADPALLSRAGMTRASSAKAWSIGVTANATASKSSRTSRVLPLPSGSVSSHPIS